MHRTLAEKTERLCRPRGVEKIPSLFVITKMMTILVFFMGLSNFLFFFFRAEEKKHLSFVSVFSYASEAH